MRFLGVGIILAVLLSSAMAHVAQAEPFVVTVPGQNWQIVLNTPPIDEYQGQAREKGFIFRGKNAKTGFLVSFIGEPWETGGNAECRAAIWAKSSQNPMIDKGSVKISDQERFSQVTYRIEGEAQGKKVIQANADFFFVFKGNCVDVHLSKTPYAEGDEKILQAIGSSLGWVGAGK